MKRSKGKPSGKYAEDKTDPGRKGDYKRSGWPEDAPTQRVPPGTRRRSPATADAVIESRGRNRKAGSPV